PVAAVLAAAAGSGVRHRGRRTGIERVQAPEPGAYRRLAAERCANPLPRDWRGQSLHDRRRGGPSAKRDGGAPCPNCGADQALPPRFLPSSGPPRANSAQADAAKTSAKPTISVAVGRSPSMRTDATTPITGLPSTPSEAVSAGSRWTIENHRAYATPVPRTP